MYTRRNFLTFCLFAMLAACSRGGAAPSLMAEAGGSAGAKRGPIRLYSAKLKGYIVSERIIKSDEEWRSRLTPEEYHVTREKGTEDPFTGAYWDSHEKGIYQCVCCGNDVFSSEGKFDSGTGWPSFREPIAPENIEEREDNSFFMRRTEVLCSRCEAHLGHVFEDGPKPSGLRYCMNSAALKFVKE